MRGFDLHCHSTVSDGVLTPAALVARAVAHGVRVLALTDHDEISGLAEAQSAAREYGLHLVPGVEISVTWRAQTVHVVGLNVDAANRDLLAGLDSIRNGRIERAQRMAAELDRLGIPGSLEGARAYAANPALIGRTHFARYLVERGRARDVRSVFQKYLAHGKPGYVPHRWASLEEAVHWISGAGGVAVVAHPGRYRVSSGEMRILLEEFRDWGGHAVEVVSSSHTRDQYRTFASESRRLGLLASAGSDFHAPGESVMELGAIPDLPDGCRPVWDALGVSRLAA